MVFCSACGRACVSLRAQAPMRISVCMCIYECTYDACVRARRRPESRTYTYTHILNGQTHAHKHTHKHTHTCMYACTHTQTHIYTIHTRGMYASACIHTVQTQIRRRRLWCLIRDSTVCFNNNLLLCE